MADTLYAAALAQALREGKVKPEQLQTMQHAQLYSARGAIPGDDPLQNTLAPAEHRAFAREWVSEGGKLAAPLRAASLAVASPAYALAKLLRQTQSRSGPSADQLAQSYGGIVEGLRAAYSPEK